MTTHREKKSFPALFHIGTQKAGSTLFYHLIKQHPSLAVSKHTELNFFNIYFENGLMWYMESYLQSAHKVDVSPSYFRFSTLVSRRINEFYGGDVEDLKFLLILRNPIDCLFSHYKMRERENNFKDKEVSPLIDFLKGNSAYVDRVKYATHLKRWLEYFDLSQFKIVIFEEFVEDIDKNIQEIFHFFGVRPHSVVWSSVSKNKALRFNFLVSINKFIIKYPPLKEFLRNSKFIQFIYDRFLTVSNKNKVTQEERDFLRQNLINEVAELKRITGLSFSSWEDFQ